MLSLIPLLILTSAALPTGSENINTAAIILEAALYHRLRQPILAAAQTAGR